MQSSKTRLICFATVAGIVADEPAKNGRGWKRGRMSEVSCSKMIWSVSVCECVSQPNTRFPLNVINAAQRWENGHVKIKTPSKTSVWWEDLSSRRRSADVIHDLQKLIMYICMEKPTEVYSTYLTNNIKKAFMKFFLYFYSWFWRNCKIWTIAKSSGACVKSASSLITPFLWFQRQEGYQCHKATTRSFSFKLNKQLMKQEKNTTIWKKRPRKIVKTKKEHLKIEITFLFLLFSLPPATFQLHESLRVDANR